MINFLSLFMSRLYRFILRLYARGWSIVYTLVADTAGTFVIYSLKKNHEKSRNRIKEKKPVTLVLRKAFWGNGIDESMEVIGVDQCLHEAGYEVVNFFWDDAHSPMRSRRELVKVIQNSNVKRMVFSSYSPFKRKFNLPSLWFLKKLKSKLGLELVGIFWDTSDEKFWLMFPRNHPFDINIATDNPCYQFKARQFPIVNDFIFLFSPYPVNSIVRPRKKSVLLYFSGQVNSYRDYRKKYIDTLFNAGFGLYIETANRAEHKPARHYYETLGKAKIAINFSMSSGFDQLKGRVFEAILSGCLLLESQNAQIECYFTDGEHYVAFDGEDDLVRKIKYYMDHKAEAKRIAEQGRARLLQYYTGVTFWDRIEKRLVENG